MSGEPVSAFLPMEYCSWHKTRSTSSNIHWTQTIFIFIITCADTQTLSGQQRELILHIVIQKNLSSDIHSFPSFLCYFLSTIFPDLSCSNVRSNLGNTVLSEDWFDPITYIYKGLHSPYTSHPISNSCFQFMFHDSGVYTKYTASSSLLWAIRF